MSRLVTVRRTGGFAGIARAGELDLDSADVRAQEVAGLLDGIDVDAVPAVEGAADRPDGFHYVFDLCGERCALAEHQLTPELRRLAALLLGAG